MINKFKGTSKVKVILLAIVIVGVFIVGFRYILQASRPEAKSNLERIGKTLDSTKPGDAFGGSGATQDFMQRNTEQNKKDAESALQNNRANLPIITTINPAPKAAPPQLETSARTYTPPSTVTSSPIVVSAPAPTRPKIEERQQQTDRDNEDRTKAMLEAMKSVRNAMALSSPKFVESPIKEKSKGKGEKDPGQTETRHKDSLHILPGSKFYVVNEYDVNSDAPKDDVIMKVVHPLEYAGARFFGHFKRYDEMLVVEFDRLLVNGTVHSIKGLAIDPKEADVDVASDVDTHFWSRWLSLAASAMLEGMGDAVRNSGTTTTITSGAVVQTKAETTTRDMLIEGAGTVGKRAQNQLAGTFNRPPTVRLYVGAELAVVVLEAK